MLRAVLPPEATAKVQPSSAESEPASSSDTTAPSAINNDENDRSAVDTCRALAPDGNGTNGGEASGPALPRTSLHVQPPPPTDLPSHAQSFLASQRAGTPGVRNSLSSAAGPRPRTAGSARLGNGGGQPVPEAWAAPGCATDNGEAQGIDQRRLSELIASSRPGRVSVEKVQGLINVASAAFPDYNADAPPVSPVGALLRKATQLLLSQPNGANSSHNNNVDSGMPVANFTAFSWTAAHLTPYMRFALVLFVCAAVVGVTFGVTFGLIGSGPVLDANVAFSKTSKVAGAGLLTDTQFWGIFTFIFGLPLTFAAIEHTLQRFVLLPGLHPLLNSLVGFLGVAGSALAIILCFVYLIQPQDTFTQTVNVSSSDPMMVAIGSWLVPSFFGLMVLFLRHFVLSLPLSLYLAITQYTPLVASVRAWNRPMVKIVSFCVFLALLGFFISSLQKSPIGLSTGYAGAWFRKNDYYSAADWVWNVNFIWKCYLPNPVFHGWLIFAIVLAVVGRRFPAVRRRFHQRVAWLRTPKVLGLSFNNLTYGISYGEAVMAASLVAWVIFEWFYYAWLNTNIGDNLNASPDPANKYPQELTSRVLGHIASLFGAMLILPVTKSCLWVEVFGVPFDRAIRIHRIIGGLCYLCTTIHGAIFAGLWYQEGLLNPNLIAISTLWPNRFGPMYADWTIPLVSLAWLLMTLSLVTAVLLRRRLYAYFLYFHKYSGAVFFAVATWHAGGFWQVSFAGMVLWLVDKISASVASLHKYKIESMEYQPSSGVVTLKVVAADRVRSPIAAFAPGQLFYVNIPELSAHQWHPFSVNALDVPLAQRGQHEPCLVFHIQTNLASLQPPPATSSAAEKQAAQNAIARSWGAVKEKLDPQWTKQLRQRIVDLVATGHPIIRQQTKSIFPKDKLPLFAEDAAALASESHTDSDGLAGATTTATTTATATTTTATATSAALFKGNAPIRVNSEHTHTPLSMVRLQGPYGNLDYEHHEHLLLFAGGLGITPMVSLFRFLYESHGTPQFPAHVKSVVLVWSFKHVEMLTMFKYLFAAVASQAHGGAFRVQLHCTAAVAKNILPPEGAIPDVRVLNDVLDLPFLLPGRCDVAKVLASVPPGQQTKVFVCGPPSLSETASQAAYARNCAFHSEIFLL